MIKGVEQGLRRRIGYWTSTAVQRTAVARAGGVHSSSPGRGLRPPKLLRKKYIHARTYPSPAPPMIVHAPPASVAAGTVAVPTAAAAAARVLLRRRGLLLFLRGGRRPLALIVCVLCHVRGRTTKDRVVGDYYITNTPVVVFISFYTPALVAAVALRKESI